MTRSLIVERVSELIILICVSRDGLVESDGFVFEIPSSMASKDMHVHELIFIVMNNIIHPHRIRVCFALCT